MWRLSLCLLIVFVALVQPALAHPGHGGHAFADGWQHPFAGLDHLLAMVAVGLLAVRMAGCRVQRRQAPSQRCLAPSTSNKVQTTNKLSRCLTPLNLIGGAAIWVMPAMVMGGMVLGGCAAALGVPLPGVEQAIMASVLGLGLLIAITKVVPLSAGTALIALFAVFHGHAHATEMAAGSTLAAYAAGFLLATALLHISGVLGGLALARGFNRDAVRVTGGLIATAGVLMFCGVL